jgi:hypothetical protein
MIYGLDFINLYTDCPGVRYNQGWVCRRRVSKSSLCKLVSDPQYNNILYGTTLSHTYCGTYSVGQPKHSRVMAGGLEGEFFFGSKAEVCTSDPSQLVFMWPDIALRLLNFIQEHRGLLNIRYPIEHGIVTHWDDMERIWNVSYQSHSNPTSSVHLSHNVM